MWKRLGKALIAIGAITSIGSNVIDAIQLVDLKLPIPAWTAIGLAIFFVGIGALIYEGQKENAALKQQVDVLIDERTKGMRLQPSVVTGKKEARIETQPSSWQGLSEAEFAQVEAAIVSMNLYHGHADYNGLIDDQKHGKPLNGLCWRCGKPRFQKGDQPK
jgi:hypothetical protein